MPTPTSTAPTKRRVTAPPTTRKTSLYRLRSSGSPATDLCSLVVPNYLQRDGFTNHAVDHEGISGLLVSGTIAPGDTDWCTPLGGLVGMTVAEQNRTSLALLLVRTDKAVYGLTFGLGHLMIDQARIDPGFGIEFAVRCLDQERITKVRRQVMDARGRTDENSATSGEHIRGFGIEQFGEIVSQISGQITGVPLTFTQDRDRPAHVTGSDRSIKLHLGTTPAGLLHDLQQIEQVCTRPSPLPEFEFIAQVRPLNPKSERALRLDDRLDEMLSGAKVNRLALAVPSDCRDRFEFAESFSIALAGKSRQVGELDVDDLIGAVADKPEGQRLRALRQGRIQMFADTEGADRISRNVPVDHWLTTEVPDGVVHYFYWQGQWYEIGAEYLTVIESRIAELLDRPSSVTMPPWPKGHDEGWYNRQVAAQPGYLLLDQDTVRTGRFRGGGLEMADVLGPDGQFICVKKADKTAPLNHLFAQGRVAIETLRFDTEAREKFLAKLPTDHPVEPSFRSPTVVYGVMLKDGVPLTSKSMFAFAKVSLLHAATVLQGMGARLEIVSISRTSSTEAAASPNGKTV
ncbi:MAG: DUF6119 family protein [Pseudonocardiaceae bacterium]